MPQNANHYSLRLTGSNDADRVALMKRKGACANSTLNAALRIGFQALLQPWDAVSLRKTTETATSALSYEGNARKFRNTLLPPPFRKAAHASK